MGKEKKLNKSCKIYGALRDNQYNGKKQREKEMDEINITQLLCILGTVLLIVEILTPTLFCLNLALSCFATSLVSLYTQDYMYLTLSWVVFSCLFLLLLRPFILKKTASKGTETGINKYIGKEATVLEKITTNSGVISIYDERWKARSVNQEEIEEGSRVVIERNNNLTMYVRKEQ